MKTTKGNAFFDELTASLGTAEYLRIESRMRVAAKIADTLKQKGMTQRDLARLLGKKPSEISRMLTGTMNLTHDTMFDLQRVLDIQLINVSTPDIREIPSRGLSITLKHGSEYHILSEKPLTRTGFPTYRSLVKVQS